jgi:hypothetical protein
MSRAPNFRNKDAVLLAILLVMTAIGPSAIAQPANSSKRRDLAGRWRLNRELSAFSDELSPGGVGDNEQVMSEHWALPVKDSQSGLASSRVREVLDATTSLEIFQHGRELTMNATGSVFVLLTRTIYTDGRPSEQRFALGDNGESQAHWNKNQFIVETKTKRGPKLTEAYELSRGGTRLYLLVKIENENWMRPLLIRRVYDRDSTTTHHRAKRVDS